MFVYNIGMALISNPHELTYKQMWSSITKLVTLNSDRLRNITDVVNRPIHFSENEK